MKIRKLKIYYVLVGFTLFFSGCAGKRIRPQIPPNPANPIRTIAILPMLNNSDDVEAPEKIREAFYKRMTGFQYALKSLEETNQILNLQMGITLGKQLDMVTPEKLGETLGVDGVFYGYLLNFDEITTVVLNTNKVRMGWKLINTKTGEQAWGRGIAVKSDDAMEGIGAGVAALTQAKDALVKDKVGPLPTSPDPMKEMPGLGEWILMENKKRHSTGNIGMDIGFGLAGTLLDKVTGSSLEKEINYALDQLVYPHMLVGPGAGALISKKQVENSLQ